MTQVLQDVWSNVQGKHSGALAGEALVGEFDAAIADIAAEHAANAGVDWQQPDDLGRRR